jgi:1,4-dihydroxy-2-naphthoyl-CoA hydrolase
MTDDARPTGPAGERASLVSVDELNAIAPGSLAGLVGFQVTGVGWGLVRARLSVRPDLMAPNGYLHAATVVALADTACGFGVRTCLPDGALGFTTLGLDARFIGTTRDGGIATEARMLHGGRSTQVWDAEVVDEATGRTTAVFRCTQLVLWPR